MTVAPRCPACGKFMELLKSYNRTATYECCDQTRNRALNSFDADLMRYQRNDR